MEPLRFLAVMLSTIVPGTAVTYNDTTDINVLVWGGYTFSGLSHWCPCMQWLVQVQWSSLRPTQLPLMCVELATSPSGVSMMVWKEWIGIERIVTDSSLFIGHTVTFWTAT